MNARIEIDWHVPYVEGMEALLHRTAVACAAAEGVEGVDRGQQNEDRQPAAPGQKGVGPHAGARALGHKGKAPDEGAEHQEQGVFGLCVHPAMPSTFRPP